MKNIKLFFLSENFHFFLVVKFSVYLKRHVFVMWCDQNSKECKQGMFWCKNNKTCLLYIPLIWSYVYFSISESEYFTGDTWCYSFLCYTLQWTPITVLGGDCPIHVWEFHKYKPLWSGSGGDSVFTWLLSWSCGLTSCKQIHISLSTLNLQNDRLFTAPD